VHVQLHAVLLTDDCCRTQVSEKIVLLDAESKELRLTAAAADDRTEVLGREKAQVVGLAEELRADVAAKMALLDEFEARFARQYRCVRGGMPVWRRRTPCTQPQLAAYCAGAAVTQVLG
jgi:hypothetical protein